MNLTTAEYGVLGRMSRGINVIAEGERQEPRYTFVNYTSPIQPRTFESLIKKGMVVQVEDTVLPYWQWMYKISQAGLEAVGQTEVAR